MNTTHLQQLKQALRQALDYVRHSTHESDGLAKGQTLRMIQNAQSLVGTEAAKAVGVYKMFAYLPGATYLFLVDGEPKFALDDWAAADSTYAYLFREMPGRIRVDVIANNPVGEDEIAAILSGVWAKHAEEKKLSESMASFSDSPVDSGFFSQFPNAF